MSARRWSKFWWQDWQRDPALAVCSLAAQGLWMRLLCLAHDGEPYGHVTINGKAPTTLQIARIGRVSEKEANKLLRELSEASVFSISKEGFIYSRRMVRDKIAADQGREAISKRWAKDDEGGDDPITPPTSQPPPNPIRVGNSLYSEAEAERKIPPTAVADATIWPDARAELWGEGLPILRGLTGKPDGASRAFLGKLLKAARDDCPSVMRVLREAADLRPAEPAAWLTAAVSRSGSVDAAMHRVISNMAEENEKLFGGLPH